MKKSELSLVGSLVLLVLSSNTLFAQDPEFTQFYANPIYLNPAFAGTARCPRMVLNYRNQWPSLSQAFVTYNASYDQHVDPLHGGVGVMVTQDRNGRGTLNSLMGSLVYSYQLNVSKEWSVKAGVQGSYVQKNLDVSSLTFGDMIDARRGFVYTTQETNIQPKVEYVDFSAGVLAFSKKYFMGFAAHHLTQPDETFISGPSALPMKFTGHAGAVIPLQGKSGNATFSPNVLYRYQGRFQQLNLGFYFSKGPVVGGLWYRGNGNDAAIALIGVQVDTFKFGYSYDFTISSLSNVTTAGSHEVSLAYVFPCSSGKTQFKTVSCPSF